MLLDAVRRCHASLFTDRAISYRLDKGFDHFKVALSVGVQKMVRADLGAAGVMFTLDTESGFRDAVFITGAYGLGETSSRARSIPTSSTSTNRPSGRATGPMLRRRLGEKQVKMVYRPGRTREPTRIVPSPEPTASASA